MKIELTPILVEILPGKQENIIRTIADIRVKVDEYSFVIPKGFASDLASVPRILWRILPPWGSWRRAAVVHDHLYRSGMYTRSECDAIFLCLMEHDRVCKIPKWLIYLGVRVGGSWSYKKNL